MADQDPLSGLVARQAKEAVRRFTGSVTVPVMQLIGDHIRPVGTGTFLSVGQRLFIVTASHLFDGQDLARTYVPDAPVNGKAIGLTGSIVRAKERNVDIAVLELLDQRTIATLRKGWHSISLAEIGQPTDSGSFVLVGYPTDFQNMNGKTLECGICTAFTTRIGIPSNANDVDPLIDLFFKYAKTAKSEDGETISTPHLRGASGGSVWEYRDPEGHGFWAPEKSLRLVGVQASTMDGEWFRGTRWSVVLDALAFKDDELRAAIFAQGDLIA